MMWIPTLLGLVLCDLLAAAALSLAPNPQSPIPAAHLKLEDDCIVGNFTYRHDETFKLDCKTQCVCENGRHACSSLCPKEMLTPPKDTRLCRSPKLVDISGHCCKVWQCDKLSEDVSLTCHNSSASPWTECTESCGIGLSTRVTHASTGCLRPSSLRLCQNRQCAIRQLAASRSPAESPASEPIAPGVAEWRFNPEAGQLQDAHKVRKGHECRNIQRLPAARIRLGPCVSRQLYRPKMCGQCQSRNKCCVPSVSTTIQVEMLCPLSAGDPLEFIEPTADLWDTRTIDPIDQELMQSHHIPLANRFIDVQWVLKCECSRRGKSCLETPGQRGPSIRRAEVHDNRHESNVDSNYGSRADETEHQLAVDAATNGRGHNEASNGIEDEVADDLQELLKRVHRT